MTSSYAIFYCFIIIIFDGVLLINHETINTTEDKFHQGKIPQPVDYLSNVTTIAYAPRFVSVGDPKMLQLFCVVLDVFETKQILVIISVYLLLHDIVSLTYSLTSSIDKQ